MPTVLLISCGLARPVPSPHGLSVAPCDQADRKRPVQGAHYQAVASTTPNSAETSTVDMVAELAVAALPRLALLQKSVLHTQMLTSPSWWHAMLSSKWIAAHVSACQLAVDTVKRSVRRVSLRGNIRNDTARRSTARHGTARFGRSQGLELDMFRVS